MNESIQPEKAVEVVARFAHALKKRGGPEVDVMQILTNRDLPQQIAELVLDAHWFRHQEFTVELDYQRVVELVARYSLPADHCDGRYDVKHFPIPVFQRQSAKLVICKVTKTYSIEDGKSLLRERGLEPACLRHLAVLRSSIEFPVRDRPVYALGSMRVDEEDQIQVACWHGGWPSLSGRVVSKLHRGHHLLGFKPV